MIPEIENILEGYKRGDCTKAQALGWIAKHSELDREAAEKDAGRWNALISLDGEYRDGPGLDGMWEYKPAGYDGCKSARYWMGTRNGSLTEIVDAAIDAARGK